MKRMKMLWDKEAASFHPVARGSLLLPQRWQMVGVSFWALGEAVRSFLVSVEADLRKMRRQLGIVLLTFRLVELKFHLLQES